MRYFKPYEGDKPYIFISYAHADSEAVMSVVTHMHDRGYRIWYDEGIEVGSEWPECIASHLTGAQLVIAFISNSYMRSDNCRREMHYALSKRIRIINVFIENTDMTPGMEMQIGSIFALMRHNMSDAEFYGKLYSAPLLDAELFADGGAPAEAQHPEPPKPAPAPAPKPEKPRKSKEKPSETERRRKKQDDYNRAHGIVPKTIRKDVRKVLEISHAPEDERRAQKKTLTAAEREATIRRLEKEMKEASKMLEFEYAAVLRDQIIELRGGK